MYTKEQRKAYRLAHKMEHRIYVLKYIKSHKDEIYERDKKRRLTPEYKEYIKNYRIKNYIPHPKIRNYKISDKEYIKKKVRAKTRIAVKNGLIEKMPCEICGKIRVEAHHDDYSQPLNVRWLCRKHHVSTHKELGSYIQK